jgi:hypothetical protein
MTEAHGRLLDARPTEEERERVREYKIRRRSALLIILWGAAICTLVLGMAIQEGASYGLEQELTKVAADPFSYARSDVAVYQDTIAFASRMQQVGLVAVLVATGALIVNLESAVGIRD